MGKFELAPSNDSKLFIGLNKLLALAHGRGLEACNSTAQCVPASVGFVFVYLTEALTLEHKLWLHGCFCSSTTSTSFYMIILTRIALRYNRTTRAAVPDTNFQGLMAKHRPPVYATLGLFDRSLFLQPTITSSCRG